jgi:hypothetical protein
MDILSFRFFIVIIVYFAGGIAFMIFVKKESGPSIVPNVTFWTSLPGYIKASKSCILFSTAFATPLLAICFLLIAKHFG